MSFSLLPDCLCSRLRGSLDEAERVVVMSEAMGVEAAAQAIRVGRLGTVAEVGAVRSVLGTERALVALREIGADHLHALGPPVGFGPPWPRRGQRGGGVQHETGPDPPGAEA
jgi:hypothetical protein